jgi:hypothetical protein
MPAGVCQSAKMRLTEAARKRDVRDRLIAAGAEMLRHRFNCGRHAPLLSSSRAVVTIELVSGLHDAIHMES